ncbi:hypothetical protein MishRS11D_25500 [Methylomagnum ishizawai]|nr:hypothetical protein MishRS11D_25500 [Methylomagnum ishizawai]
MLLCGWRCPDAHRRGGCYADPGKVMARMEAGHQVNLEDRAVLSGWPTPNTPSGGRSVSPDKMDATGRTADGKKHTASLEHAVKFVAAPWNTPRATDGTNGGPNQAGGALPADAAMLVGWATPLVNDGRGSTHCYGPPGPGGMRALWLKLPGEALLVFGPGPSLSPAGTEKPVRYRLNPYFAAWLMGYPEAWTECGLRAASRLQGKKPKAGRRSCGATETP